MFHIKNLALLIVGGLILSNVRAQEYQDVDILGIGYKWKTKLSELESSMVIMPDSYMAYKDLSKARVKIEKEISKITVSMELDPADLELYNNLILQNTNASLWYSEVTTEDFQLFIRRLVTGRPINKDVIQNLKKSYLKWIKNPTIKNLNRYSQMLMETGRSYEILTKLKVSTKDPENTLIKYRPVTSTNIETLKGPMAEKIIPVGNYYIWLEKDGKVLSDNTNGFPCIRSTKNITLSEF